MTQLTIDGETFRVEIEGEATKPALVLSHALGTDLSLWDAQMPALTKHFRVVRYDARGHGGSAVGQGPYALERLGRDVIGILDALEIERAHIVGISMGGSVAQWLMIHAPERIERAVLANTAAKIGTPEAWNGRIGKVMDDGMDAIAADMMERWFSTDFADEAPEKVAAVDKAFRATSPEGYVASCTALRDMDLRHAVGGIRHPVLVIRGKDDPVASEDDAEQLVESIAGAKLVALDAKHISPVEAERAFADAVIRFLTAKAPARARTPALPRAPRKAAGPVRRQAKRSLVSARSPVAKAGARTAAKPAAKAASKAPASKTPASKTPAKATKPAAKSKAATPGRRSAAAKAATRKAPARTSAATRTAVKKAAPTKARARTGAVKAASSTAARKTPSKTTASRSAAAKTTTRTSATKEAAKGRAAKPVAKRSTAKVAPARRTAASAASRATPARKKAPVKSAKVPTKGATKAATKKTAVKKAAAKRTAKLPAPRRKAATTPRRPAGRRKP